MAALRERYGPWALVTGASAGIGQEFARQLAAHGLNLVLVARRADRLRALAAELESRHGVAAIAAPLDLASDDFLDELQPITTGLEVGLLVNSAGFSLTGEFLDHPLEDQLRLLYVKSRAPLMLAHRYGRAMRQRGRGGVIFVSSITGFVATPLWSHYAATNAYGLLLGEGLAAELRPHGVDVLALCPGTTRTEFLEVAEINSFMAMDAPEVVAAALKSLGRTYSLVPGWFYKLSIFTTRFLPRRFNSYVFGRLIATLRNS